MVDQSIWRGICKAGRDFVGKRSDNCRPIYIVNRCNKMQDKLKQLVKVKKSNLMKKVQIEVNLPVFIII